MKSSRTYFIFLFLFFLNTTGVVTEGQEKDSLYIHEESLRKEASVFTDRAYKDGVISAEKRDSLTAIISSTRSVEPGTGLNLLHSVIKSIDMDYDGAMEAADNIAIGHYLYNKNMLPERLSVPEDYISPEEARQMINQRTSVSVSKSISDTFKMEELMGWQKWMRRHGLHLSGNQAVYEGRAIPQMGGLYYITVPGGAPAENKYGQDKFPKQR